MIWYPVLVSAVLGCAMLGLWGVLISRNAVPELAAGLPSIRFHIAAELVTAVALLMGAAWLLVDDGVTARLVAAAGLGALTYSAVNSPGYYADRGNRAAVVAFGVLAVAAIAAIVVLIAS